MRLETARQWIDLRQFARFSRVFVVFILLFAFSACSGYKQVWPANQPLPGTKSKSVATGAIAGYAAASVTGVPVVIGALSGSVAGGAIGDYFSEHEGFAEKLDIAGIKLVAIGEDIKIILPSDRFLYGKSTKLNPAYYPALDGISDMIANFDKTTVKVAGFTDDVGDDLENLAISRAQAQMVANYLMRHHIDARLIYSIGYGCEHNVSSNLSAKGRSENRRVEITLRRIPGGTLV